MYCLKASAQAGLCYTEIGEHHAAIKAFRTALSDESTPPDDVIELQYLLARTLESIGEVEEAATLYSHIAQRNLSYKDAARRSKELSRKPKRSINGKREITRNGSWFGNVIESFNHLIGSRK